LVPWDRREQRPFKTIDKFRFADSHAFDFRGESDRTLPQGGERRQRPTRRKKLRTQPHLCSRLRWSHWPVQARLKGKFASNGTHNRAATRDPSTRERWQRQVFRVPGEAVRMLEAVRTGIALFFRSLGDSIHRMRITKGRINTGGCGFSIWQVGT